MLPRCFRQASSSAGRDQTMTRFTLEFVFCLLLLRSRTSSEASPVFEQEDPPTQTSSFHYDGGRLLVDPITVYLIWYGNWTELSKQAVRTAILSLNEDSITNDTGLPSLSRWWKLVTQYKDHQSRSVSGDISLGDHECAVIGANVFESDRLTAVFKRVFNASVQTQDPMSCTGIFKQDRNALYHVLISQDVKPAGDFAFLFFNNCAGRSRIFKVDEDGPELSLAWQRLPEYKEFCHLWTPYGKFQYSPNGERGGLDSMISFLLAQTATMATNWDFKGWIASNKQRTSVGHQCPSPTGWDRSVMPVVNENRTSWNVLGRNGSRYLVQQLWDQSQKNCALQPSDSCQGIANTSAASGIISHGLIVNHKVGLQPYNANLTCEWLVHVPSAIHIDIKLNYLAIGEKDHLLVYYDCGSNKNFACGRKIKLSGGQSRLRKVLVEEAKGSKFRVKFTSSRHISPNGMGWHIIYQAGFCKHKLLTSKLGSLTDGTPERLKYRKDQNCSWLFNALPGTKGGFRFTRFNTISGLDVVKVYQGLYLDEKNVLATYSGNISRFSDFTFRGPVLMVFTTTTDQGRGWALNYYMESPSLTKQSSSASPSSELPIEATAIGALCGMLVLSGCLCGAAIFHPVFQERLRHLTTDLTQKKTGSYSIEELNIATNRFSSANLIASGVSGKIYKGVTKDGEDVVIKNWTSGTEFDILMRIRVSTIIVSCVGFCFDSPERKFLVFDYMAGGCLSRRLFEENARAMSWEERLRIAVQVSSSVEYLHTYAEPFIVHCNICADNVLLDSSGNAKLGGFGNAFSCIKPAFKAEDVYRVGCLLLELVTGKKVWDGERNEVTPHATASLSAIESDLGDRVLDKRLSSEKKSIAVVKMGEIAAWCMKEGKSGPSMVEVASAVKQVFTIFRRSGSFGK